MSYVDFGLVKSRVDIVQVLDMLGIDLQKSGSQLRGPCPIHGGDNPRSFVVTPSKNAYYCFGECEKGGDTIELVSRMRGLSHKDAALEIAKHFGLETTKEPTTPRELEPLKHLQTDHKDVLTLGLSEETLKHFGAGYAPKGIHRGKLAVPIFEEDGTLVAYVGIDLKNKSLAYPKGYEPDMFNVQNVQEGTLYVTRNPLTVLTAYENGIENCVALLGDITPRTLERLSDIMGNSGCEDVELF